MAIRDPFALDQTLRSQVRQPVRQVQFDPSQFTFSAKSRDDDYQSSQVTAKTELEDHRKRMANIETSKRPSFMDVEQPTIDMMTGSKIIHDRVQEALESTRRYAEIIRKSAENRHVELDEDDGLNDSGAIASCHLALTKAMMDEDKRLNELKNKGSFTSASHQDHQQ